MTPLIRPGSDSRKNWRTINDHTVQLTGMDRRINAIDGERRQVYGGGSGGLLSYRVKSNLGDILICRRWNGTAEVGPEVFVAVNHQSRQLGSETINGITYTYTSYTDIGDGFNYTRISTSSADSSTESQIVTPMWYNNCVIAV
ncbi:MAG TPA: hypothetical protein VFZ59_23920, partial [Verrucomicrobiae bacterium]|nr:hypothetical protein [Verrucomicrobiae bacterium]